MLAVWYSVYLLAGFLKTLWTDFHTWRNDWSWCTKNRG